MLRTASNLRPSYFYFGCHAFVTYRATICPQKQAESANPQHSLIVGQKADSISSNAETQLSDPQRTPPPPRRKSARDMRPSVQRDQTSTYAIAPLVPMRRSQPMKLMLIFCR